MLLQDLSSVTKVFMLLNTVVCYIFYSALPRGSGYNLGGRGRHLEEVRPLLAASNGHCLFSDKEK